MCYLVYFIKNKRLFFLKDYRLRNPIDQLSIGIEKRFDYYSASSNFLDLINLDGLPPIIEYSG